MSMNLFKKLKKPTQIKKLTKKKIINLINYNNM